MVLTSDMLFYSRLPSKFFELVTNETSKFNPGNSLRSYLVAHAITQDAVDLPQEINQIYKECFKFSTDDFVIQIIKDRLAEQGAKVLVESEASNPRNAEVYKTLKTEGLVLKDDLTTLFKTKIPDELIASSVNLQDLLKFRHLMFKVANSIEKIEHTLIQVPARA